MERTGSGEGSGQGNGETALPSQESQCSGCQARIAETQVQTLAQPTWDSNSFSAQLASYGYCKDKIKEKRTKLATLSSLENEIKS